jgi:23S rRNA (pseudouridine1915-N3)-methyltransferase
LDEKGKSFTSVAFARHIEQLQNHSTRQLVFVVGGAFGFSEAVHNRAQMKLSLSEMTFSHQLIRLIFMEQLYRAFTILNNHPYHNT